MTLAGLGFIDWATGDIPSEAQIQGFWQNQVVMHFATTAARDLAITTPLEGMHAYVAATKSIYYYDGAAWVFKEGWGTGSPEAVVTAKRGAVWHRTDGGASTTVYVKESDTTNTGWAALGGGAPTANDSATVATSESTTSTTPTDLATPGPAVTVTTGTKALVIIGGLILNATAGGYAEMTFAVSGATTRAASSDDAFLVPTISGGFPIGGSMALLVKGLTAGANTFTAKYSRLVAAGTAVFEDRKIAVVNMGS